MSLYVMWVNLIKEKADERWLTDSQREVYEAILEHWQSQPFVNLCGPRGAGKTFLARLLAKHHGYAYVHELAQAPPNAPQVVLDDAEYDRALRPLARDLGLGRVLLITETPVRETMPKVELVLDTHDVYQFCANLSERCGIPLVHTLPEGLDLGEILRREVIARGEAHVSG
jgi:energy-coupling factor transporter ATP-binding protein EcfA2